MRTGNPVEDTLHVAKIITPAGLIVKVLFCDFPKGVREAIKEHDPVLAAETYARQTGLRVTLETTTQITATPKGFES